jgi:mannose-6-phosphate isomerase-like protein (cupin superfamily)
VSVRWATQDLPDTPDRTSPDGTSEIWLLPSFESGELVQAIATPGRESDPAALARITEFFYVLEGRGELRRTKGRIDEISELIPGRCASVPPEVGYQYRAVGGRLWLIVCTAPRWERENWRKTDMAPWPKTSSDQPTETEAATDWHQRDLPNEPDYLAPDGSEIRLLLDVEAGGLAHCTLPAGGLSSAVRHRSVEEIWYVLEGDGELWRKSDDAEEVVEMRPQRCLTIPARTAFQFRSSGAGPLRFLIGTFPRWPGKGEAEDFSDHWRS